MHVVHRWWNPILQISRSMKRPMKGMSSMEKLFLRAQVLARLDHIVREKIERLA